MSMKILIIEDEQRAAARLSELILSIENQAQILGIVDSIESGIEWFSKNNMPELIFSDIELADGTSFKLFKQVTITCPIIFTTAYNQYMIEAFETNAVSYILKPISREQVAKALEKYHSMREAFAIKSDAQPQIEELLKLIGGGSAKRQRSTLMVNKGERIIPILIDTIAYIYATNSGLQINTNKGVEYSYNSTLDELEKILDNQKFYRANRQFIIARNSIQSIERYFNRTLVVKLLHQTPEQVGISRLKAKSFLEWMEW